MNNFWHDLPQPFFSQAPMEAVTDVVFRHVIAAAAPPDVWFSEFTNATGWVHAGQKAIGGRLLKSDDEKPIVAQIWGGEPGDMEQLAAHCLELGYHGIDINMGCPAKSAVKSGGAALIRQPELAVASIAAAKTAGLPVSVKTRLGYTRVDEWRQWLTTLLEQDIVNLTIHLRTKREMSKVPAHHELIPEIVALRDQIAPSTLLTINGDIENRQHGLDLVAKYPGVNGVMIGRGVFHNPFAFVSRQDQAHQAATLQPPQSLNRHPELDSGSKESSKGLQIEYGMTQEAVNEHKNRLINLLHLHLDLYDQYQSETNRPFETLKRFFKVYIRNFDGASDLRHELMQAKSTDEVRQILKQHC